MKSIRKMKFLTVAAFVAAGAAQAADLGYSKPVAGLCTGGPLLSAESTSELKSSVVRLMDEAVNVSESPEWIGSSRPAFLWASEAKVACGKAYGYLRSGTRDEDYLYKCECFHARMISYMN